MPVISSSSMSFHVEDLFAGQVQFFRNKHLACLAMSAWAGWLSLVDERKAGERLVVKMQLRSKHTLLASAFYQWTGSVQDIRAARTRLLSFVDRQAVLRQEAAFNGWRLMVSDQLTLRAKLYKAVRYMWSSSVLHLCVLT